MTPFVHVLWESAAPPPAAFPTVVTTSVGATSVLTANPSVDLPASIVAGNALLMLFRSSSVTHTGPSGWTQVFSFLEGAGVDRFSAWRKVATSSEPSSVAFGQNGTHRAAWNVYQFGGVATGETSHIEAATAADTFDPPNLTPSWGSLNTLWVTGVSVGSSSNTLTLPTGYGNTIEGASATSTASSRAKTASARRTNAAASEDPAVWTASGTTFRPMVATIALRPG